MLQASWETRSPATSISWEVDAQGYRRIAFKTCRFLEKSEPRSQGPQVPMCLFASTSWWRCTGEKSKPCRQAIKSPWRRRHLGDLDARRIDQTGTSFQGEQGVKRSSRRRRVDRQVTMFLGRWLPSDPGSQATKGEGRPRCQYGLVSWRCWRLGCMAYRPQGDLKRRAAALSRFIEGLEPWNLDGVGRDTPCRWRRLGIMALTGHCSLGRGANLGDRRDWGLDVKPSRCLGTGRSLEIGTLAYRAG